MGQLSRFRPEGGAIVQGILSGRILSGGEIVKGDIVLGKIDQGFCLGAIAQGILSRGYCIDTFSVPFTCTHFIDSETHLAGDVTSDTFGMDDLGIAGVTARPVGIIIFWWGTEGFWMTRPPISGC